MCKGLAPRGSFTQKWLPVVKTANRNPGNDGIAGKMLKLSILSDSPSKYVAKAVFLINKFPDSIKSWHAFCYIFSVRRKPDGETQRFLKINYI